MENILHFCSILQPVIIMEFISGYKLHTFQLISFLISQPKFMITCRVYLYKIPGSHNYVFTFHCVMFRFISSKAETSIIIYPAMFWKGQKCCLYRLKFCIMIHRGDMKRFYSSQRFKNIPQIESKKSSLLNSTNRSKILRIFTMFTKLWKKWQRTFRVLKISLNFLQLLQMLNIFLNLNGIVRFLPNLVIKKKVIILGSNKYLLNISNLIWPSLIKPKFVQT